MANDTIIKYEQIIGDINRKIFQPIYTLEGEEPFFIDKITETIEQNVLEKGQDSMNKVVYYGKDTELRKVISECRTMPFGSQYKLVIIKEAQNIGSFEELSKYFDNPVPTTVLVICYKGKKFDKRQALSKKLSKYALFTSDKLRDYETVKWLDKFIRNKGKTIDSRALDLIIEYLGSDLQKINNEIEKMLVNVPKEVSMISPHHIENNIGISKEYNIFEYQKALGLKDFNKSIQIANYFAQNPKNNSIFPILTNLYSFFSKVLYFHSLKSKPRKEIATALGINEFFLDDYRIASEKYFPMHIEQVFGMLKYYDLKAKGVNDIGTEEGQLIIEMTVKILKINEISNLTIFK